VVAAVTVGGHFLDMVSMKFQEDCYLEMLDHYAYCMRIHFFWAPGVFFFMRRKAEKKPA